MPGVFDPFATMKRLQAERPRTEFDYPWERTELDASSAQQRQDAFMVSWTAHQAAEQAERARPAFEGVWPIPR
jgi:hypothetical protein